MSIMLLPLVTSSENMVHNLVSMLMIHKYNLPFNPNEFDIFVQQPESCLEEVRQRMNNTCIKLNDLKTEYIMF